jgi:hypothetical protein
MKKIIVLLIVLLTTSICTSEDGTKYCCKEVGEETHCCCCFCDGAKDTDSKVKPGEIWVHTIAGIYSIDYLVYVTDIRCGKVSYSRCTDNFECREPCGCLGNEITEDTTTFLEKSELFCSGNCNEDFTKRSKEDIWKELARLWAEERLAKEYYFTRGYYNITKISLYKNLVEAREKDRKELSIQLSN